MGEGLDAVDAVVHEEDLAAAIDLAQDGLANQRVVLVTDEGADRQPLLRRCLDHAHVAHVYERHMQRARDRRGGERQHVYLGAKLLQALLMGNAEALLLVDDQQAQIGEDDVFGEQAVRADDDVYLAGGDVGQDLLLLFLGAEAAKELDADGVGLEPLGEGVEVLQGKDGGRHEDGHLALVKHGLEGGAQGHFGLAVADVAADETVHRAAALHIGLDLFDGAKLVGRLFVGEGFFELLQPGLLFVAREGVADGDLANGVEPQQVAGDVGDALFGTLLGLDPLAAAELAEGGRGVAHADVARDAVELVSGDVELVGAGVLRSAGTRARRRR